MSKRNFLRTGAGAVLLSQLPPRKAVAQEKVIRFTLAQDFTKVYTFVTAEYVQGQRDYYALVNGRGGINGYQIVADVSDHGNDIPRAIEAYERGKASGSVLIDPLSTPVARALGPRVLNDKINMVTAFSGRSDAADGTAFPYILPLSASYWTQAGLLVDYFRQHGGLKGKRVCFVHIDTPFGKEPLPILNKLAAREGFELLTFPYTPPGNDQTAVWPKVRRARPSWVMFWGAGVGQTTALSEGVRNGIDVKRMASCVWLSESDMQVAGAAQVAGVLKVEFCASGREPKLIQEILKEVVGAGKGVGLEDKVGTTYYNYGVMIAATIVEGVRKAFEKAPAGPITGPWLNAGLRSISNFNAEGLMPPMTVTEADHQGGGLGRIAHWDGKRFVPNTDYFAANQDLVWEEVRKYSEAFKKSGQ